MFYTNLGAVWLNINVAQSYIRDEEVAWASTGPLLILSLLCDFVWFMLSSMSQSAYTVPGPYGWLTDTVHSNDLWQGCCPDPKPCKLFLSFLLSAYKWTELSSPLNCIHHTFLLPPKLCVLTDRVCKKPKSFWTPFPDNSDWLWEVCWKGFFFHQHPLIDYTLCKGMDFIIH